MSCSGGTAYPLLEGGTIDVKAPGKVLIINNWATWCAPCRKEIPELNELASHHNEKLMVVGVNFDGSQDELLENEKMNNCNSVINMNTNKQVNLNENNRRIFKSFIYGRCRLS